VEPFPENLFPNSVTSAWSSATWRSAASRFSFERLIRLPLEVTPNYPGWDVTVEVTSIRHVDRVFVLAARTHLAAVRSASSFARAVCSETRASYICTTFASKLAQVDRDWAKAFVCSLQKTDINIFLYQSGASDMLSASPVLSNTLSHTSNSRI